MGRISKMGREWFVVVVAEPIDNTSGRKRNCLCIGYAHTLNPLVNPQEWADMGIIDTHSKHSLYDILGGELSMSDQGNGYVEPEGSIDFYGFHIYPATAEGDYNVQYDGHAGTVDTFNCGDFDDVLELVDYLMEFVIRAQEYDYQDDKEGLVDWAGKIMTSDSERAKANPDLYIEVPDSV